MNENILVRMKFGSHLYGTDTPDSDQDFKGVFLPTENECFLNKISKSINYSTGDDFSKNSREDTDEEIFSLQEFIKLALRGEMIVIDMLHAPDNMILQTSTIWKHIQANRNKFYSKNLAGYLGYIRTQTAKYGIKGERLSALSAVLKLLNSIVYKKNKLSTIWNLLPTNEYCRFVTNPKDIKNRYYECCGKQYPETITIEYAIEIISSVYNRYGARAKMAEANEGVDWKAVSHAFRAGIQLKEIYTTGDLIYPLKDAEYLRDMKQGKLHYKNDNLGQQLEDILTDVESLAQSSNYPTKLNHKWFDDVIINTYIGDIYK